MNNPLLSVCITTYNHSKYIKDAIEGVLKQKVNFLLEIIIADDFSTDGTREIILEYKTKYPGIIKLLLQEKNVGAAKNWLNLVTTPTSKYIAYFDGDDYWIDQNKLQKEVDFLETHPEYGLVHTDYLQYHERRNKYLHVNREPQSLCGDIFLAMLKINYNQIITSTLVARTLLINDSIQELSDTLTKYEIGDYPMVLSIASKSKIGYLNDVTSVYRILKESSSHSKDVRKSIGFRRATMDIIFAFSQRCQDDQKKEVEHGARNFFFSKLIEDCLHHPEIVVENLDELNLQTFSGATRLFHVYLQWTKGGLVAKIVSYCLNSRIYQKIIGLAKKAGTVGKSFSGK